MNTICASRAEIRSLTEKLPCFIPAIIDSVLPFISPSLLKIKLCALSLSPDKDMICSKLLLKSLSTSSESLANLTFGLSNNAEVSLDSIADSSIFAGLVGAIVLFSSSKSS